MNDAAPGPPSPLRQRLLSGIFALGGGLLLCGMNLALMSWRGIFYPVVWVLGFVMIALTPLVLMPNVAVRGQFHNQPTWVRVAMIGLTLAGTVLGLWVSETMKAPPSAPLERHGGERRLD